MRKVERSLFVVGNQGDGKSSQLNQIKKEIVGKTNQKRNFPIRGVHWLYIRAMSPQETGESMEEFLEKCESYLGRPWLSLWSFASALQASAGGRMPGPVETIQAFKSRFSSQRVRVVILSPNYRRVEMNSAMKRGLTDALKEAGCEVVVLNARRNNGPYHVGYFGFDRN